MVGYEDDLAKSEIRSIQTSLTRIKISSWFLFFCTST